MGMKLQHYCAGPYESAHVAVKASFHRRIKALAARNRMTIGAQIAVLLEEPLAKREAQGNGVRTPV